MPPNRSADSEVTVFKVATGEELEAVEKIYRKHKATLGFFPEGAFQDRYRNGQILAAAIGENVVGYVIFQINRTEEVRIAHLATATEFEGFEIPRFLSRGLDESIGAKVVL